MSHFYRKNEFKWSRRRCQSRIPLTGGGLTPLGSFPGCYFRLKEAKWKRFEEASRIQDSRACKVIDESRGDYPPGYRKRRSGLRVPTLMQGIISEDISSGIDWMGVIPNSTGVFGVTVHSISLGWFLCGRSLCRRHGQLVVVKPSSRSTVEPGKSCRHCAKKAGFPPGVINFVQWRPYGSQCHDRK